MFAKYSCFTVYLLPSSSDQYDYFVFQKQKLVMLLHCNVNMNQVQ